MEEFKKKNDTEKMEKEILYSQAIKAGKRIYYMDVKKNRKDDLFIAITESKKVITEDGGDPQVNYEKHKIFLYKEDFEKFTKGLQQAIQYIQEAQQEAAESHAQADANAPLNEEIKIDIDF